MKRLPDEPSGPRKRPVSLTQSAIGKLHPGDYLADAALPGLGVSANRKSRTFVYRYRDLATGKLRQVTR